VVSYAKPANSNTVVDVELFYSVETMVFSRSTDLNPSVVQDRETFRRTGGREEEAGEAGEAGEKYGGQEDRGGGRRNIEIMDNLEILLYISAVIHGVLAAMVAPRDMRPLQVLNNPR
jgi:hypothetical protein